MKRTLIALAVGGLLCATWACGQDKKATPKNIDSARVSFFQVPFT